MSLDISITAKREVEIYESNVTYNLADMYYKCIDEERGFEKLEGDAVPGEIFPVVEFCPSDRVYVGVGASTEACVVDALFLFEQGIPDQL